MSDSQLLSLIVLIEWFREQSEVELVGDVSRGRREGGRTIENLPVASSSHW